MCEMLEDFSPPAVVTALEANVLDTFPRLGHTPRGRLQESPEVVWYTTGVACGFYNMVVRARLASDAVDTKIEAIMRHFQERQAPMYWFLGPTTTPADLGWHLEAHGLVYEGDDPRMAVELSALPSNRATIAGLSIQQVRDAAALEQWVETFIVGYEIAGVTVPDLLDVHAPLGLGAHPPWRHYLGFLHGWPVATSWLSLGAGVAGIYGVAAAEHRHHWGARLHNYPQATADSLRLCLALISSRA